MTVDSLSEGMPNPATIIGIHYFNPAHIIPLVEVHRGAETSDAAYELTQRLMEASGKKTVLCAKRCRASSSTGSWGRSNEKSTICWTKAS